MTRNTIRRRHRKSRLGCHECKHRRIKCNEGKPQCASCGRRGLACVYPAVSAQAAAPSPNRFPLNLSTAQCPHHLTSRPLRLASGWHLSPLPNHSDAPGGWFEMRDMALLHHWGVSTSLTIFQDTLVDMVWQKVVPRIAFRYSYVMHSVLSLAALHLASTEPSRQKELLLYATRHHDEAIAGFRQAINNLDDGNCHAVFATAMMNTFYIFSTLGRFYHGGPDCKPLRFVDTDWISMARGIGAVVRPVFEALQAGPFGPLFVASDVEKSDSCSESTSERTVFDSLRPIWINQSDAEVYEQTLQELRRAFSHRGNTRHWSRPFIWLHAAPDAYLDRLNQRQPPALVLLAYFGVLTHNLDALWWAEGCGKEIVQGVTEALGPYWAHFMEWPRQLVGFQ